MARRTPPIAEQVVDPFINSNARFKKRLIDFDTGSANLENQHISWLRDSMAIAKTNSGFHIRIFGYASRRGDAAFNKRLSLQRMNAVMSFLQKIDSRTLGSVETWQAHGEEASSGGVNDDSPSWRAVEVHIFIGEIPPTPVPPGIIPVKPTVIPLPGGERFKEWQVATPGGAFVSAVAGIGFNIFIIKNTKLDEIRSYIQPVAGVGASVSIPNLRPVWNVIQQIVTGVQGAPPDFTAVTTTHPVTWEEMEGCLVRVSSAGGGTLTLLGPIGGGFATITFSSSGVYQYDSAGLPIKVAEDLFQFTSIGKNWQIGVNASVVIGPLVRADTMWLPF